MSEKLYILKVKPDKSYSFVGVFYDSQKFDIVENKTQVNPLFTNNTNYGLIEKYTPDIEILSVKINENQFLSITDLCENNYNYTECLTVNKNVIKPTFVTINGDTYWFFAKDKSAIVSGDLKIDIVNGELKVFANSSDKFSLDIFPDDKKETYFEVKNLVIDDDKSKQGEDSKVLESIKLTNIEWNKMMSGLTTNFTKKQETADKVNIASCEEVIDAFINHTNQTLGNEIIYKLTSLKIEVFKTFIRDKNVVIYMQNGKEADVNKRELYLKSIINYLYINITELSELDPKQSDNIGVRDKKDIISKMFHKYTIKTTNLTYNDILELPIIKKGLENYLSLIENQNTMDEPKVAMTYINTFIQCIKASYKNSFTEKDWGIWKNAYYNTLVKIISKHINYLTDIKTTMDDLKLEKNKNIFYKELSNVIQENIDDNIITYLKLRNNENNSQIDETQYNRRFKIYVNVPKENRDFPNKLVLGYNSENAPYYKIDVTKINGQIKKSIYLHPQLEKYLKDTEFNDGKKFTISKNSLINKQVLKVNSYENNYVFGQFSYLFTPELTNAEVADKMSTIKNKLLDGKPVFVLGYGASGAGKTSSLIYYNKGRNEQERDGILVNLCNVMGKTGNYGSIKIKCKEFYLSAKRKKEFMDEGKTNEDALDSPTIVNIPDVNALKEYGCSNTNDTIDFTWKDKDKSFNLSEPYVHINHHQYRLMKRKNYSKETLNAAIREKLEKDNKDRQDKIEQYDAKRELLKDDTLEGVTVFNTEDTSIGKLLIHLIDKDRFVKATTNNPNSSRSHTLVFVEFVSTNDDVKNAHVIIGDFAGVENKFNCENPAVIDKFLAVKRDDEFQEPFYDGERAGSDIDPYGKIRNLDQNETETVGQVCSMDKQNGGAADPTEPKYDFKNPEFRYSFPKNLRNYFGFTFVIDDETYAPIIENGNREKFKYCVDFIRKYSYSNASINIENVDEGVIVLNANKVNEIYSIDSIKKALIFIEQFLKFFDRDNLPQRENFLNRSMLFNSLREKKTELKKENVLLLSQIQKITEASEIEMKSHDNLKNSIDELENQSKHLMEKSSKLKETLNPKLKTIFPENINETITNLANNIILKTTHKYKNITVEPWYGTDGKGGSYTFFKTGKYTRPADKISNVTYAEIYNRNYNLGLALYGDGFILSNDTIKEAGYQKNLIEFYKRDFELAASLEVKKIKDKLFENLKKQEIRDTTKIDNYLNEHLQITSEDDTTKKLTDKDTAENKNLPVYEKKFTGVKIDINELSTIIADAVNPPDTHLSVTKQSLADSEIKMAKLYNKKNELTPKETKLNDSITTLQSIEDNFLNVNPIKFPDYSIEETLIREIMETLNTFGLDYNKLLECLSFGNITWKNIIEKINNDYFKSISKMNLDVLTSLIETIKDMENVNISRSGNFKTICDNRRTEGTFINHSLMQIRSVIKEILFEKNADSINIAPNFIDICFDSYCPTKENCFSFDKPLNEANSVIMDSIYKELKYDDDFDGKKRFFKDLIVSVFCVFNISREANNPPPTPYIDINTIKLLYKNKSLGSLNKEDITKFIEESKKILKLIETSPYKETGQNKKDKDEDNTIENLLGYEDKLSGLKDINTIIKDQLDSDDNSKTIIEKLKYLLKMYEKYISLIVKNKENIATLFHVTQSEVDDNFIDDNVKYIKQGLSIIEMNNNKPLHMSVIEEFIDMINNSNAISSLGTLEFLDQLAKFNSVSNVCRNNTEDLNKQPDILEEFIKDETNEMYEIYSNDYKDAYNSYYTKFYSRVTGGNRSTKKKVSIHKRRVTKRSLA